MSAPESTDSSTLRERRRLATRLDIESAAVELFEVNGYDGTTVEQIAARAGVSMRTFYRYCPNKHDAITLELVTGPAQLVASIAAHDDRDLLDAVIEGFVATIDVPGGDLDRERRLLRVIVETAVLRAAWLAAGRAAQDDLTTWIARRRPRLDSIAARALAAATTAALTVAIEAWATGDRPTIRGAAIDALEAIGPALRE